MNNQDPDKEFLPYYFQHLFNKDRKFVVTGIYYYENSISSVELMEHKDGVIKVITLQEFKSQRKSGNLEEYTPEKVYSDAYYQEQRKY